MASKIILSIIILGTLSFFLFQYGDRLIHASRIPLSSYSPSHTLPVANPSIVT